jgi:hypothetical protein
VAVDVDRNLEAEIFLSLPADNWDFRTESGPELLSSRCFIGHASWPFPGYAAMSLPAKFRVQTCHGMSKEMLSEERPRRLDTPTSICKFSILKSIDARRKRERDIEIALGVEGRVSVFAGIFFPPSAG